MQRQIKSDLEYRFTIWYYIVKVLQSLGAKQVIKKLLDKNLVLCSYRLTIGNQPATAWTEMRGYECIIKTPKTI